MYMFEIIVLCSCLCILKTYQINVYENRICYVTVYIIRIIIYVYKPICY